MAHFATNDDVIFYFQIHMLFYLFQNELKIIYIRITWMNALSPLHVNDLVLQSSDTWSISKSFEEGGSVFRMATELLAHFGWHSKRLVFFNETKSMYRFWEDEYNKVTNGNRFNRKKKKKKKNTTKNYTTLLPNRRDPCLCDSRHPDFIVTRERLRCDLPINFPYYSLRNLAQLE